MKVFSPFLNGDTTTSGSLNLPQHPTASAIINPNTGSIYHDTTDNVVKVYTGTQWQVVGEQVVTAPVASADIEYLLVAGGGGAAADSGGGAGGGAGGLLSSSLSSVTSGSSFTITVGGGGAGYVGGTSPAGDGTDSSLAGATISTITATGGGGAGSSQDTGTIYLGHDGGSGGGSGNGNANYTRPNGGSGTVGQGNDGGGAYSAAVNDGNNAAGGGGGAGAVGADAASGAGGNGGDGLQSSITGTSTYYAGGGAGGTRSSGTAGTGGQGGGGNANNTTDGTGQDGEANTGGGAGGSRSTPTAAGGSGVAIFAYDSGSINCAGGIVGDAGNGRKYNQFNSSGTFKVGNTTTDFDNIVTDSLSVNLDAGNFASRGTSTWTDLQGNYNGTANGSISLPDYYYDFDGTDDYVQFATGMSSLFEGQSTVSVEFWCQIDSVGSHVFFGKYASNVQVGGYQFNTDGSGQPNFFVANSSDQRLTANASTALSANTWTHLVYIFDGSQSISNGTGGRLRAFKDTTELSMTYGVTTNHTTIPTTSTTGVKQNRLGVVNFSDGSGAYLSGKIAQFRVYSKVLTDAEITQNYNATKTNFV